MTLRLDIVTCALAAFAVTAGCASTQPSPQPEWVDPPRGYGGDPQPVDIYGTRFYPMIVADASGPGGDVVDTAFQLELVDPADGSVAASTRATLVGTGTGHLQAVIPAQVDVGVYDLRVTGPDGAVGELSDAYRVTNSPVEKLQVVVPSPGEWFVGQPAQVELQLLGRDDLPELASLPIEVIVEKVDGGAVIGSLSGNLVDSSQLQVGSQRLGLAGTTRADGSAMVDLTLDEPGVVALTVRIPDPDVGLEPVVRTLTWLPGDAYDVEVELPEPGYQATAGSSFPVRLTLRDKDSGAVVEQPSLPVRVVLSDLCGDLSGTIVEDLKGTRVEHVQLRTATADAVPYGGCEAQAIQVALASDRFVSEPVTVLPGPSERLYVEPLQSSVVAGSPQRAIVRVADRFENVTGDDLDPSGLHVTDSVGDVDTAGCEPIDGGAFCVVTPTDAERAVSLLVEDPRTLLAGTSRPYEVVASVPDSYGVAFDPGIGVQAGSPFRVIVRVFDEYGNDVDVDDFDEGSVAIRDPRNEAACTWRGPAERGELAFDCTLFTAGQSVLLASGGGVSGESDAFDVHNGALTRIELAPSTTSVTAGERFELVVSGFDLWDNPYIVRAADRVDLIDDVGGLDVDYVSFGPDGEARASVMLTRAGEHTIIGRFMGADLGESPSIRVSAASASGLVVGTVEPWGFAGSMATVRVQAVDDYDNPTDLDEDATISARWGTFTGADLEITGGQGQTSVYFTGSSLAEQIRVRTRTGLEGLHTGFVVGRDCGSSSPSVAVDFDGSRDAIACHIGGTAEIDASFAGSITASGTAPRIYALWTEHTGTRTSASDRVSIEATRTGRYTIRGLVADASTCAAEVSRTAWVGADDGQPVGPMSVSLGATSLSIGSDKTTISLTGVTTCDGNPAEKGTVYLRTDRGEVTGATASGSGLRVTLDSAGDASATLDLVSADTGGDGTITAWAGSGAALGTAAFSATGDLRRPTVILQDPLGFTTGTVEQIDLVFSEPIDADTLDESDLSLAGPASVSIDEVEVDENGRSATVWLSSGLDASTGRWSLSVLDSVTDKSGNHLDGEWSGSRSDHVGSFGKVSAVVPDLTSCTLSRKSFRPDGDNGAGIETDSVGVSVRAVRQPDMWRMVVEDALGNAILTEQFSAGATSAVLRWGGVDDGGRVVRDGLYTITLSGVNADGSEGTSCEHEVTVDNDRGF